MMIALMAALMLIVVLWLPTLILTINEIIYYAAYILKDRKEELHEPEVMGRLSIIVPVKGEPLNLVTELFSSLSKIAWDKSNMELIMVSDDDERSFKELKNHVDSMKPPLQVKLVRREKPLHGRTGALNEGLKHVSGDYVLVMDVDSEVDPNFPREAVKLARGDVVAVVSRWRGRNFDTLVSQAVSASMDFTVDCLWGGRQALGLPLYVIGSGTLFRKDALDKLGGWCSVAPQDDMDMGAKIMKAGYKVRFMEYPTLVENPRTYSVFRYQQVKWAYGTADVLRRRAGEILRAPIGIWARLDSTAFLMQYMAIPTLFLAVLVAGLGSVLLGIDLMKVLWPLAVVHIILLMISAAFYGSSLSRHGLDRWRSTIYAGRSSAVMGAMAPHLLVASLRGFLHLSMDWRVTPKGKATTIKGTPLEIIALLAFSTVLVLNLFMKHWVTSFFALIMDLPYIYVIIRFPGEFASVRSAAKAI